MSSVDPYTVAVRSSAGQKLSQKQPAFTREELELIFEQFSNNIETTKLQLDEQVPAGREEEYRDAENSLKNFMDAYVNALSAVFTNNVDKFKQYRQVLIENFADFAQLLETIQTMNVREALSEPDFIVDSLAEELLFASAGENIEAKEKLKKLSERQRFVRDTKEKVCDIWSKAIVDIRLVQISARGICNSIGEILIGFTDNLMSVVKLFPYVSILIGSIGILMSLELLDTSRGIDLATLMQNFLESVFVSRALPSWQKQLFLDAITQLRQRFVNFQDFLNPSFLEYTDVFGIFGFVTQAVTPNIVRSSFSLAQEYASIFIKGVAVTAVSQAPRTIAFSLSNTAYQNLLKPLLELITPDTPGWKTIRFSLERIQNLILKINNAASQFFLLTVMIESILTLSFYSPTTYILSTLLGSTAIGFGPVLARKAINYIQEKQKNSQDVDFDIQDNRPEEEIITDEEVRERSPERKPPVKRPIRRRKLPKRL